MAIILLYKFMLNEIKLIFFVRNLAKIKVFGCILIPLGNVFWIL